MDEPDIGIPPDALTDGEFHPCPACGLAVERSPDSGPLIQCPYCGEQFYPPVVGEFDVAEDDQPSPREDPAADERELSALRIKQVVTLRRGAYRTRTYWIVGTAGCVFAAMQLVIYACPDLTARRPKSITLIDGCYLFFALIAMFGAVKFFERVISVQREINADLRARELEELEAAKHEPDFSTLSDGSQQARNLEQIFDESEEGGEG